MYKFITSGSLTINLAYYIILGTCCLFGSYVYRMKNSKQFKDVNIREPLEGFKDLVGQEVRVKNFVAHKISEIFQKWGYEQIVFPLVERASSFSEQVVGGSPWPEWDKRSIFYLHIQNYRESYNDIPEQVPSLLVPEGTISVSRWLAKVLTANKDVKSLFPIKVFYITPCFRNELISKLSATKGREFNQVGVEILGASNLLSDIEVLFLIHEGFKAIKIPNDSITVRIGSVELFNLLCDESDIDEQTKLVLKNSLDTIAESRAGKQPERLQPEINKVLKITKDLNFAENLLRKWKIVCNTFVTNLDRQTEKVLGYSKPIKDLNTVAAVLQARGIRCVIDPSVVRSHEYYTEIVYEIDLKFGKEVFVEVAGGGRDNKLISKFLAGKEYQIPAVGFAYGLERISEFFNLVDKSKGKKLEVAYWTSENSVDKVFYSDPKTTQEIIKLFSSSQELREKGERVSVYVGDGEKTQARRYSKDMGARFISK